jgi:transposase
MVASTVASRRRRMGRSAKTKPPPDPWRDAWTRYSLNDTSEVSFIDRINAHHDCIVQRGGFDKTAAAEALKSPDPAKKEEVANWLRRELRALDILQEQTGRAPVLVEGALSRVLIADLAVTLLQYCERPPGLNLVHLLAELLGVDRHRTALAKKQPEKKFRLASIVAELNVFGERLSDRRLAKMLEVSPMTIKEWKRAPNFEDNVRLGEQGFREKLKQVREKLEQVGTAHIQTHIQRHQVVLEPRIWDRLFES